MERSLSADAGRKKRLAAIAAGLFALAGVIIGVNWYIHREIPNEYQLSVIDPLSANASVRDEARQRRENRAKLLRNHWQSWARQHQALLRQMLHSQPNDMAMLAKIYNVLPGGPTRTGGISHEDLHGGGCTFTWQTLGRSQSGQVSDPVMRAHLQRSNAQYARMMRDDFTKYRDFALSYSENTGTSRIVLWASGRITEAKSMDFHTSGKPVVDWFDYKEIVPPYDFLQGHKTSNSTHL